jgi:hypothetical protein
MIYRNRCAILLVLFEFGNETFSDCIELMANATFQISR